MLTELAVSEPIPPRSKTIRGGKVAGAVRAWLQEHELQGADLVRARLALKLAAELDSGAVPPDARARLAGELRAVIAELEAGGAPRPDADVARRLLEDVWR